MTGAWATFGLAAVVWAAGVRRRDASLVDRVWGLFFIVALAGYLHDAPSVSWRGALVFALVSIWGVRLSWHIHQRNAGHGEDPRYVAMRVKGGSTFWWQSFYRINLLQALIALLVSAPLFVVARAPEVAPSLFDAVGVVIFAIGLGFEVVGDAQLKRFKADPAQRGQVLRTGLWAWTRHPNYFGDALLWWGLGVIAAPLPLGLYSLVGPALMTFLLRRVSGVALLEKALVDRKPGYAAYVREVPAFLPRPPRK